jgi:hypothetical protein
MSWDIYYMMLDFLDILYHQFTLDLLMGWLLGLEESCSNSLVLGLWVIYGYII